MDKKIVLKAALIGFILGLLLLFAEKAHGAEVDIEGGVTKFTQVANGNWYQEGFPYHLQLTSPTAGFLVLTDKDQYGLQFGAGAGNYGRYQVDSMILDFDANYNPNSATHCNGPCQPLSHLQGAGNIPYFELAARKTFNNGVFVGLSVVDTRASFHVTNFDWQATPPYGNAGPLKFDTHHEVVNKFDLAASVGYHYTDNLNFVFEVVPTHAPNDQVDVTNPTGRSYFRILSKGYSPRVLLEYTVTRF